MPGRRRSGRKGRKEGRPGRTAPGRGWQEKGLSGHAGSHSLHLPCPQRTRPGSLGLGISAKVGAERADIPRLCLLSLISSGGRVACPGVGGWFVNVDSAGWCVERLRARPEQGHAAFVCSSVPGRALCGLRVRTMPVTAVCVCDQEHVTAGDRVLGAGRALWGVSARQIAAVCWGEIVICVCV